MTKVIKVYINPEEEAKPTPYILKLEDIICFKINDYEQYYDKEEWFYAIEIYLMKKLQEQLNCTFVMEEYKTAAERDKRVDEIIDIINYTAPCMLRDDEDEN